MENTQIREDLVVTFDLNTIDHLGVKLYSTIPPMIAELVSNAWDADAHNVYLHFNDDGEKTIRVRDDGRGMTFDELNSQFLKIGRNRRIEDHSSQTPDKRPVLGKKGLGKLSMFGIGKRITITTIKSGYRNSFRMDYDRIKTSTDGVYRPDIINYQVKSDECEGTTILIENISRKTSFDKLAIMNSLKKRFNIYSSDFRVHINDQDEYLIADNSVDSEQVQFSWAFPNDFVSLKESIPELYQFGLDKGIKGTVFTSKTPVSKDRRGIVLFARGKLVQENDTFNERSTDNFFQYMFGEFHVDFIDEDNEIDNCSTDRKSLAWDTFENDDLMMLKSLLEKIVSSSQSMWRTQRKAEKKKRIQERGHNVDQWLKGLNPAERPLATKLANAIIDNESIDENTAGEYLRCIQDMYGMESFKQFTAQLDEMDALDNESAIKLLTDWQMIEAKEYAKIAIGRVKTIDQFERYILENASENKIIQKFLEEFPWLLDPKMSRFEREVTYTKMLKQKFPEPEDMPERNRRLDFLCTNSSGMIHIIELKRPQIKITFKELQQITEYVEFIKRQFPETVGHVKGFLISDKMEMEPGIETMRRGLENEGIYVKSYSDLLAQARRYHQDMINTYEQFREAVDND